MTYDQLIEKIRIASRPFLKDVINYDAGSIFNAVNDSLRDLLRETKDQEITPANLSVTAGTSDYNVSTIGSDVGDITAIYTDLANLLVPASVKVVEARRNTDLSSETTGVVNQNPPMIYRVWNSVIRFYPTPSTTAIYKVYYTKKVTPDFYSVVNGAATIPVKDDYLNALKYRVIAQLCEELGSEQKATYYLTRYRDELNNAMGDRSYNDNSSSITYHGL